MAHFKSFCLNSYLMQLDPLNILTPNLSKSDKKWVSSAQKLIWGGRGSEEGLKTINLPNTVIMYQILAMLMTIWMYLRSQNPFVNVPAVSNFPKWRYCLNLGIYRIHRHRIHRHHHPCTAKFKPLSLLNYVTHEDQITATNSREYKFLNETLSKSMGQVIVNLHQIKCENPRKNVTTPPF